MGHHLFCLFLARHHLHIVKQKTGRFKVLIKQGFLLFFMVCAIANVDQVGGIFSYTHHFQLNIN